MKTFHIIHNFLFIMYQNSVLKQFINFLMDEYYVIESLSDK